MNALRVLPAAEPTVVHMLSAAAGSAPQGAALVCGGRSLDYAGYAGAAAGCARELQSLGATGDRVATLAGNSIEACVVALGALAAGAQQVPLNPLYTAPELATILEDAAPAVLVVDAALAALAGPVARRAGVRHVLVVDDQGACVRRWLGRAADGLPAPPDPDSLALLQYTGGTTGRPKGVELTHRAIAVNVAQREALLPTRRGDRILCMMPLSHAYAMSMGLFLSLHCAGALVILPRYQPEQVLDTVPRERIAVFLGSPTIFTGLLAHPRCAQTDWRTVHTCYSGSAALAAATLDRWRDTVGVPVYEGYGQTEAGPVLTFNPAGGPVKAGTVGVPVPLTEIEIVDLVTGETALPSGQCGEIRARGPQLMRGYRNRPEETAQALRGGWLYTGDIGELDADGYLAIRDRKKDMVIVGGYNVYPREVEEVLFAHPDVADAAVVGRPDDYLGEALVAHVVLRPGARADGDALLAHCRDSLARFKLPAHWHFARALPKTLAGKTDKTLLRRSSHDQPPPRQSAA
jgi:long-chain acyl-CoA synthetase